MEYFKFQFIIAQKVSIEDFYTRAEKDFSDWPLIHISIDSSTIRENITYEDEYEIIKKILNDEHLFTLTGVKLVFYLVETIDYNEIKMYFDKSAFIDSSIKNMNGNKKSLVSQMKILK